ncbi:M56 family metallopeptidase [Nitratireductor sp. XY-223]|uniref:M56 family metallopeptidase n=1 Tax=Nitratireductor sp. XY-223 TaxID=2561926 RepID=UPI0010AA231D|nr:M56 family metallopeptidase [Nitratireductor sp. XY-223]
MIPISAVLDAYLNINILMAFAFGLWLLARLCLNRAGMKHAYVTQLKLLNGLFLAVCASPVLVACFALFARAGVLSPDFSMTLSDIILAQYLQGRFEMNASQLEVYLVMRNSLTSDLVNINSQIGIVISAVLAGGFLLFAARLLLSMIQLRRIIRNSFTWRRFGNVHLLLSDTARVPFSTRTLRRRFVVIPSSMLGDGEDVKIALCHEFQHIRQYDIEWELALEFLKPLFFWNPVFYLWKRQIEYLRELSCDQRVLARKHYDIEAYCECLLRVCQNSLRRDRLFSISVPGVALVKSDSSLFGNSPAAILRRRLVSLFEGGATRNRNSALVSLLVPLVAMVALATVAIQKPNDWSQDRIMLSTIVNLDRLAMRNSLAERPDR